VIAFFGCLTNFGNTVRTRVDGEDLVDDRPLEDRVQERGVCAPIAGSTAAGGCLRSPPLPWTPR
jgi:hypothetical protein